MAIYNLGRILPNYRGTWSSQWAYMVMDIVYYDGSSYVAKSNVSAGSNNPSINNDWQIIALKGELSGTLTPEQEQAIINAIMAQGVVIDASYNHTDNNYTDADRSAVQNINYGTLTLQKNGTTAGTFTADTDSTVNITVPTRSTDLADGNTIVHTMDYIDSVEADVTIDTVKPNTVYSFADVNSIDILSYGSVDPSDKSTWIYPPTYIFFKASPGFGLSVPTGTHFTSAPTFIDGEEYRLTIIGAVIRVEKLFI